MTFSPTLAANTIYMGEYGSAPSSSELANLVGFVTAQDHIGEPQRLWSGVRRVFGLRICVFACRGYSDSCRSVA